MFLNKFNGFSYLLNIFFFVLIAENYTSGARIFLDNNKLTGLNAAVFQPILDLFVKNGFPANSTFISFFKQ